jgi:hypothetical protein
MSDTAILFLTTAKFIMTLRIIRLAPLTHVNAFCLLRTQLQSRIFGQLPRAVIFSLNSDHVLASPTFTPNWR